MQNVGRRKKNDTSLLKTGLMVCPQSSNVKEQICQNVVSQELTAGVGHSEASPHHNFSQICIMYTKSIVKKGLIIICRLIYTFVN